MNDTSSELILLQARRSLLKVYDFNVYFDLYIAKVKAMQDETIIIQDDKYEYELDALNALYKKLQSNYYMKNRPEFLHLSKMMEAIEYFIPPTTEQKQKCKYRFPPELEEQIKQTQIETVNLFNALSEQILELDPPDHLK